MLPKPHKQPFLKSLETTAVLGRNRGITPYKQEVAGSSPALPTIRPFDPSVFASNC